MELKTEAPVMSPTQNPEPKNSKIYTEPPHPRKTKTKTLQSQEKKNKTSPISSTRNPQHKKNHKQALNLLK